eukprot:gene4981-5223_t
MQAVRPKMRGLRSDARGVIQRRTCYVSRRRCAYVQAVLAGAEPAAAATATSSLNEALLTPAQADLLQGLKGPVVKITAHYHVNFGDCLKVIGSSDEFGAWDAAAAPLMTWGEGDVWSLVKPLGPGEHEFKVVVQKGNGLLLWEDAEAEENGLRSAVASSDGSPIGTALSSSSEEDAVMTAAVGQSVGMSQQLAAAEAEIVADGEAAEAAAEEELEQQLEAMSSSQWLADDSIGGSGSIFMPLQYLRGGASMAGCGLPPGPYGLLGAAEGLSYLSVLGFAGTGLAARVGSGGKQGLPGALVVPEVLAYGALGAGLLVLASQLKDYGYIPPPLPGGQCYPEAAVSVEEVATATQLALQKQQVQWAERAPELERMLQQLQASMEATVRVVGQVASTSTDLAGQQLQATTASLGKLSGEAAGLAGQVQEVVQAVPADSGAAIDFLSAYATAVPDISPVTAPGVLEALPNAAPTVALPDVLEMAEAPVRAGNDVVIVAQAYDPGNIDLSNAPDAVKELWANRPQ